MKVAFQLGVVLVFGLACSGFLSGPAPERPSGEETDPVLVVPVPVSPDGTAADEAWCCEYVDNDGQQIFALLDGGADACSEAYGALDGRWVNSHQCTPCCCESPLDPFDESKGLSHERTTPSTCARVGMCVSAALHPACRTEGDAVDTAGAKTDDPSVDPEDPEDPGGTTTEVPVPEPAVVKPRPKPRPRSKPGPVLDRKGFKRGGRK